MVQYLPLLRLSIPLGANLLSLRTLSVFSSLDNRFDLILIFQSGGCYLFSNLRGCDGSRVYFPGTSCVAMNGELIGKTRAYSLVEVEVVVSTVDLEDIRQYRNSIRSWTREASVTQPFPRIPVDFALSSLDDVALPACNPIQWSFVRPEEEIELGPACWLWDYLR